MVGRETLELEDSLGGNISVVTNSWKLPKIGLAQIIAQKTPQPVQEKVHKYSTKPEQNSAGKNCPESSYKIQDVDQQCTQVLNSLKPF